MGNLLEKIKEFFGFKAKTKMLPDIKNGIQSDKKASFQSRIVNPTQLSPSQEIEKVLARRINLSEKNIELNGFEGKDDEAKFQVIRDEAARRRDELRAKKGMLVDGPTTRFNPLFYVKLNFSLKPKVEEIVTKLYEQDPQILDEDRKNQLIEMIKNQTGVDEKNSDKTFNQWVIDQLYDPARYDEKSGLPELKSPEIDYKPIIESVMTLDEFVQRLIEHQVNVMQVQMQNASVIGEKFGVAYAMSQAINPNCMIPEELQNEYADTEDYKEKMALGIQRSTDQIIEEGTLSKKLTVFRQKFVDSQLFSKSAILSYSYQEYMDMMQQMLEEDIATKNINENVTKYDADLMKKYMLGLWDGAHCIAENNHENTYFEKYEEYENDNGKKVSRYHYYKGQPNNQKEIEERQD